MNRVKIKNLNGAEIFGGLFNTQEEADAYIAEHSGNAFGLLERLKPTTECTQEELDIAIGTEIVDDVEHKRLPQMFTVEQSEVPDPSTVRIPLSTFTNTTIPEHSEFVLNEAYSGLNNLEAMTDVKLSALENRLDHVSDNTVSMSLLGIIESELESKADLQQLAVIDNCLSLKADCASIVDLDNRVASLALQVTNTVEQLTEISANGGVDREQLFSLESMVEAKADSSSLFDIDNRLSNLSDTVSAISFDNSVELEQILSLQNTVDLKADVSSLTDTNNTLSVLSDEVSTNSASVVSIYDVLETKADNSSVIELDNRVTELSDQLVSVQQDLTALTIQFETLMAALDNFMIKLDADAVAQNAAVTGSSLDIDYQTSFNNDLV